MEEEQNCIFLKLEFLVAPQGFVWAFGKITQVCTKLHEFEGICMRLREIFVFLK